jgi:hypothetical protein
MPAASAGKLAEDVDPLASRPCSLRSHPLRKAQPDFVFQVGSDAKLPGTLSDLMGSSKLGGWGVSLKWVH